MRRQNSRSMTRRVYVGMALTRPSGPPLHAKWGHYIAQALVQSQLLNPSKISGSIISWSNLWQCELPPSTQHSSEFSFKKLVCPFAIHLQEKFSPFSLLTVVQTGVISQEKYQRFLFTNLRVMLSTMQFSFSHVTIVTFIQYNSLLHPYFYL